MSTLKKDLSWQAPTAAHPVRDAGRRLAAGLLLAASAALARRAAALTPRGSGVATQLTSDPRIEFHAEAGAPEGALYVDGQLVGRLHGVSRL